MMLLSLLPMSEAGRMVVEPEPKGAQRFTIQGNWPPANPARVREIVFQGPPDAIRVLARDLGLLVRVKVAHNGYCVARGPGIPELSQWLVDQERGRSDG